MEGGGLAVDADVRDVTPGADEPGRQLEGGGYPHRFDGDVGPEATGQLEDNGERVLAAVVDDDVGAERLGRLEPASAWSMATMWVGL